MQTPLASQYKKILGRYLPAEAVLPVFEFLDRYAVHFRISRDRRTRLGDYSWPRPDHPYHSISVNGNINPYRFLAVLLHEMAHLDTRLQYQGSVRPHGHEWQRNYVARLKEYRHCFPAESLRYLDSYTARIPLNRRLGISFEQSLNWGDSGHNPGNDLQLNDLPAGSVFRLAVRPNILFQSMEKRRVRWICRRVDNGRRYVVPGYAPVLLPPDRSEASADTSLPSGM